MVTFFCNLPVLVFRNAVTKKREQLVIHSRGFLKAVLSMARLLACLNDRGEQEQQEDSLDHFGVDVQ